MAKQILVAKIAIDNVTFHIDKLYDYVVPSLFENEIKCGSRVLVSFGKGKAERQGVVFELYTLDDNSRKLKTISSLLDKEPILSEEMLELAVWLKKRTFCTLFDAVKAILPPGINLKVITTYKAAKEFTNDELDELSDDERQVLSYLIKKDDYISSQKVLDDLGFADTCDVFERLKKKEYVFCNYEAQSKVSDASVKMVKLAVDYDEVDFLLPKLTKKQKTVIELLKDIGSASVKEICYFTGFTSAVLAGLEKKGVIKYFENRVYRTPKSSNHIKNDDEILLTSKQEEAFESLKAQYDDGKGGVSLLFGVTGSGKTQVFIKMIDHVIKSGRGIIVMVPEISLTPQTIALFNQRYGEKIAIFHSGLSLGERRDEWYRVKEGKAQIAVGTRSAVFAPFDDVGLIIMDEEQENTYKSESSPRYHARDVARYRVAKNNSLLILASATPSIESYTYAKKGKYTLNVLDERYGDAKLPEVITVDMKEEQSNGNKYAISSKLLELLEENLFKGHQSIVLMNRRGYNTFAACNACGHVLMCPNCSISLTYHSSNHRLMCHYCGYSEPFTEKCKECKKAEVRYSGIGTQRIEEQLKELIPKARILRMDTDTTMSRYAHEEKFLKFADKEFDIMLGTQMVAKGLDFENVTLVGVISVDQQLYNDDFQSGERAFDLLTQVIGRSGRGAFEGKAVIQTMTPENNIINLAKAQDYDAFYNSEIVIRKAMIYPPYCDICVINFSSADKILTKYSADEFLNNLRVVCKEKYSDQKLLVLGPLPPRIEKVSGKYRYRLIIKCKNSIEFRNMISELIISFGNDKRFAKISTSVDINPSGIY